MKKKEYKKLLEDIDRILAKRKRIFDRREEKRKRLVIEINVKYEDWTIDCPRDQNKPASYRSSYMKGFPLDIPGKVVIYSPMSMGSMGWPMEAKQDVFCTIHGRNWCMHQY